ncbi:hypothetical protein GCM10009560_29090 [Nonomuraea longicatena]|uniref:Uncharacterized protein n=1 Tax=Nonomuraea longicatena TaxID=83682 RepID=A0ABN1PDW8_9ACTN
MSGLLAAGEPVAVWVTDGEVVGSVDAPAVQPATPIMRMAPAHATRLTLGTAAPHFAVLMPWHP